MKVQRTNHNDADAIYTPRKEGNSSPIKLQFHNFFFPFHFTRSYVKLMPFASSTVPAHNIDEIKFSLLRNHKMLLAM